MSDRVALITGASSGIGAAVASAAAEADFKLALAGRNLERLNAVADQIGGEERPLAVQCDVTQWDQQEAMVAATLERFGRLDLVVANAGFGAKRGFQAETPEHWHDMILANVLGVALTVRASLDAVRESTGHFVVIGSVAGRRALPGSIYSATKWAVTGMAEGLRQELHGSGVRTTLISPGAVDTPFFESELPFRALEAEDVARAVMYAVSQPPHVDTNEILLRSTAQES